MEETTTYVVEVPVNKKCARCGRVFPYTEFAPNSSGLTSSCRECRGMASHASKWRKKKGVKYTRYCIECNGDISDRGPSSKRCQMCQDTRTRELALLRTEKRQVPKKQRAATRYAGLTEEQRYAEYRQSMLFKYHITTDDYESMLLAQNGTCAICHKPETMEREGTVLPLAIDHDHACCPGKFSCGKCIRGLICHAHNTGLGYFHDDIEEMLAAIEYLENWQLKKDAACQLQSSSA